MLFVLASRISTEYEQLAPTAADSHEGSQEKGVGAECRVAAGAGDSSTGVGVAVVATRSSQAANRHIDGARASPL